MIKIENPKTYEASQKTPDELNVLCKRITDLIPKLYLGDFVEHEDYVPYLNLSEKEMNKLKKNDNQKYHDNQSLLVSYSTHNLIVDQSSPDGLPIIEEFEVVFNIAEHDKLKYGCWRGKKIDYDGNAHSTKKYMKLYKFDFFFRHINISRPNYETITH